MRLGLSALLSGLLGRSARHSPAAALAIGGIGSFTAGILAALAAFGVQILLSRLLGVKHFGDYAFVLAWVSLLATLCTMGLDAASLRFVPTYRTRGDWAYLRGFLRESRVLTAGLAIGIALLAAGVTWLVAPRLWPVVAVAAVLLPILVSLTIHGAFLQGLHLAVTSQLLQGLLRPAVLAGLVGVTYLVVGPDVSVPLIMATNVMATAATLGATAMVTRAALPPEASCGPATRDVSRWTRVSLTLLLITASQTLLISADSLMLGGIVGTQAAGIYIAASQLAATVSFAIGALNAVLAPLIAELYAADRRDELQRVVTLAARGALGFAVPVAAVLWVAGGSVLGLYGPDFREGWLAMAILVLGQLVMVGCGSVGFLMTMTGQERVAGLVIVLSAILNLCLNAVLIPVAGMTGAAVATAIAVGARSLVLTVLVNRYVGVSASALGQVLRVT